MTLPESLLSYGDCMDFFEKIVDDPKGGRVVIGSFEAAHHFRQRCNKARKLHREESKRIYSPDRAQHGTSDYDPFMLKLKEDTDGKWWVYAHRMALQPGQVELLSELEGEENGNQA